MEEISLAPMLAEKMFAGATPEVNLRKHVTHMALPSVNKAAHSGFETQRRRHQRFTTGASVATIFLFASDRSGRFGYRENPILLASLLEMIAKQV